MLPLIYVESVKMSNLKPVKLISSSQQPIRESPGVINTAFISQAYKSRRELGKY